MKKIWSILLVLQVLFLVGACVEITPVDEDKYDLSVLVYDQQGSKAIDLSFDYHYKEYDDLLTVLDMKLDLDYDISQYGAFIKGINHVKPMDSSYWFSLYVNDALSDVGIMGVEIVDNLKIEFKLTSMKSKADKEVDLLIYHFFDSQINDYISDDKIDYYVFSAYQKMTLFNQGLARIDSFVTKESIKNMGNDIDNLGQAFRLAIYYKALNIDTSQIKTFLDNQDISAGAYAVYSYYPLSIAKYLIDQTIDTKHLDQLSLEVNIADADYAGMALQVLSIDQEKYQNRIAELTAYLQDSITADGYLDYQSKASASSTAQAVLGLVSVGVNPSNMNGVNAISALMAFKTEGGFSNQLAGKADLFFSTPQVYAALMAYKIFNDTYLNPSTSLYF